jgi:hypothetical protein
MRVISFMAVSAWLSAASPDVAQLQLQLDTMSTTLSSRIAALESTITQQAKRIEQLERLQPGHGRADIPCNCNSFNSSITVDLVNGVDVVKLANSAVTRTGDQFIAGLLSVEQLKIGETWKLSVSEQGQLLVSDESTQLDLTSLVQEHSKAIQGNINAIQGNTGTIDSIASASFEACDCINVDVLDNPFPGGYAINFFPIYCQYNTCNVPSRSSYLSFCHLTVGVQRSLVYLFFLRTTMPILDCRTTTSSSHSANFVTRAMAPLTGCSKRQVCRDAGLCQQKAQR